MNYKNRLGEKCLMNCGMSAEVVEYRKAIDMDVMFEDGTIVKNVQYYNFLKGNIKNKNMASNYNTAFMGDTCLSINYKFKDSYGFWKKMIQRCYDIKFIKKQKTYSDCSVCDEWLSFENFECWHNENYYSLGDEIMNIDKDILVKGNKIYSPETCIYVPKRINNLFTKRQNNRGEYPIGVNLCSDNSGKFEARCNTFKDRKYLGRYNTSEEAFEVYKNFKESYIKTIANEYKNKYKNFPEILYDVLCSYCVEITD